MAIFGRNLYTVNVPTPVLTDVTQAAKLLRRGEIVAFPTETVYGLGAGIFQERAIEKIFEAKKRPRDNPLIAHIARVEQMGEIAREIPEEAFLLAEHFFPGPLTLVLKKQERVPEVVSRETIAVRMPLHPLALELIERVGEPLVAPSANLSGKPSSTRVSHVLEDFDGAIAAVLDGGPCSIGIESTVLVLLDSKSPVIAREGSVSREEIERVLGKTVGYASGQSHVSPGTRYRHYAPKAEVLLFFEEDELQRYMANTSKRRKIATPQMHTLYEELRATDREGYEEICFLCGPKETCCSALMNRLMCAAQKTSV